MMAYRLLLFLAVSAQLSAQPVEEVCPLYACVPRPPDQTPCQNQCQSNRDCGPRGLCCPTCGGCSQCLRGSPVPNSCRYRGCPYGQVCVRDDIVCITIPCDGYRCVNISTKPGQCPAIRCAIPQFPTCRDQCRTDNDCRGSDKCCSFCDGCRICYPQNVPRPCGKQTQCPGGEVCVADPFPRCVCKRGRVYCYAPPCEFSRCDNHPFATCRDSYCGGCFADWIENGRIVKDCVAFPPVVGRYGDGDS